MAIAALLVAATLAGCGGAGGHGARRTTTSAEKLSPIPIVHETHADIVAAVAACRAGVETAHWLSPANKEELHQTCNHGLSRGLTEVKQYGREVCTEVAYTSPAKTAAQRTHVFDACYAGTKLRTTVAR
jgi:hypothetical protein